MFHGSAVYSRWLASLEYSIDRWLRLWQAPLVRPQADKCGWSRRCVIARRDTSTFSNGRNVQSVISRTLASLENLARSPSGKEQNLSELITFRVKVSARNCCYSSCGWRQVESCQEQKRHNRLKRWVYSFFGRHSRRIRCFTMFARTYMSTFHIAFWLRTLLDIKAAFKAKCLTDYYSCHCPLLESIVCSDQIKSVDFEPRLPIDQCSFRERTFRRRYVCEVEENGAHTHTPTHLRK